MKKLSILFLVALILGVIEVSFADSSDFAKLFEKKNSDLIVFYSCEQGESLESACSSVYEKTYFKFKKNDTVLVCYGENEEQGTWTSNKDTIKVKDPHDTTEYTFVDGIYLYTVSEETGDLIAYKLSK